MRVFRHVPDLAAWLRRMLSCVSGRIQPIALLLIIVTWLSHSGDVRAQTTIDNFENRTSISPWTAWKTSGTGTTASVGLVSGYASSQAMSLGYGFNCTTAGSTCGQYAAARLSLATPMTPGAALSIMTRSPASAEVFLRVVDQSDQVLQYRTTRPAEGYDSSIWYQAVVDLKKPTYYGGGANNGVIQSQIKAIWIIVETRTGSAASGSVSVDNLTMHSTLPGASLSYVNGVATIDNFENRTTVAPWTAWKTSASGTSATLSTIGGYSSTRAMSLGYGFNCTTSGSTCGQYAAAILSLTTTVSPGAALSFMTRSPAEAEISVRLLDQSGQTLQYRTTRPPEGYDATAWYQAVIDLKKPLYYWGGANNGVIQGQIKAVWIMAETRTGKAASGSVAVDNLAMLATMPSNTTGYVNGVATIDNFENRTSVSPWTAWKTSGTGTTASVATATGYSSTRALSLAYGFNCTTAGSTCSQYAAATLTLATPLTPGAALSFMTRSAPDAIVSVRVVDQSGQSLQYLTTRPLDGYDPAVWYKAVVDLSKPTYYWGGANNGVIQGQVKGIWVVVETRTGAASSGTVFADDIAMLSTLPATGSIALVGGIAKIDDFENRSTIAPWVFQSSDALTTGYLDSTAGFGGSNGLSLSYNFTCLNGKCGSYAVAYLQLPTTVSAGSAVKLRVRSPAEARLSLRVQDASGQYLQYSVPRPLEAANDSSWYSALLPLAKPNFYWGGANNGIVQSPIKAVAVVVNNDIGKATSGDVSIDELATVDSLNSEYTLVPSSTPLIAAPSTAQSIGTRVGVAHVPSSASTPLDIAKSAGIKLVRTDMILNSVENAGVYDFRAYDNLVAALEARGMGALFILRENYENARYDVRTAAGIATFSRIVEEIARHYTGRNVRFEIWNEPDIPSFWFGAPNAPDYAALCEEATAAIHRGNPAAKVSTGGLSHFHFDYLEAELAGGAARYADAIAIHGYRDKTAPETLVESLLKARSRIEHVLGEQRPIWITEWGHSNDELGSDGHSTAFRQRQALLLSRQVLSQWVLDVPITTWFNLVDSGTDRTRDEHNFGLVDAQYVEKPALTALRTITTMAQGRTYKGLASNTPPGLHVMRLEDSTRIVFVAWNSDVNGSVSLHVPTANIVSTTNFLGASISGGASSKGSDYRAHTLTETLGPIYITYLKP